LDDPQLCAEHVSQMLNIDGLPEEYRDAEPALTRGRSILVVCPVCPVCPVCSACVVEVWMVGMKGLARRRF
jgi:hypothetical protein